MSICLYFIIHSHYIGSFVYISSLVFFFYSGLGQTRVLYLLMSVSAETANLEEDNIVTSHHNLFRIKSNSRVPNLRGGTMVKKK